MMKIYKIRFYFHIPQMPNAANAGRLRRILPAKRA